MTSLRTGDLLVVALALRGELDEALALGRDAAERALREPGQRAYVCREAGLPIAAAELLRSGRSLDPEVAALVATVLRKRRREALALPTAAPLWLVAEAAWRSTQGLSPDFAGPIASAERMGLGGEAALCRLVAERFGADLGEPIEPAPRPLASPPPE